MNLEGTAWATSPEPLPETLYWIWTGEKRGYQPARRENDVECYWHYTNKNIPLWDTIIPGSHVTSLITLSAAHAHYVTGVPQMPTQVCRVCAFKAARAFQPANPPYVKENPWRTPPVGGGADDYITGIGATCVGCNPLNP